MIRRPVLAYIPTMYDEEDRAYLREAHERAPYAPPERSRKVKLLTPQEIAERDAVEARRQEVRLAEEIDRTRLVVVHCSTCGAVRVGSRDEVAKWRRCAACQAASVRGRQKKFCRRCGRVMLRADYLATPGACMKGWATLATCGCKK